MNILSKLNGSFLKDCCLKQTIDNNWLERKMRDSGGSSGKGETSRSDNDEEAHRPLHGKRASGAEINLSMLNSNKV